MQRGHPEERKNWAGTLDQKPNLNIVTNFSRARSHARNKSSTSSTPYSGHSRNESIQQRRQKIKQYGPKSAVESLRNATSKVFELSPSDGTLVIGIDESIEPRNRGLQVRHSPLRLQQPSTPEIIVTPAELKSRWSLSPESARSSRRLRASSIYSRATQLFGSSESPKAPPMPTIPQGYVVKKQRPLSNDSWATEFSDDDTLHKGLSRPRSREDNLHLVVPKRDSQETILTPRSNGWWNQILSPFLERSATSASKKFDDVVWKDSGHTADSHVTVSRETDVWADLTGEKDPYTPSQFFKNHSKDPTFNDYPGVHQGALVATPELVEKVGLAEEYFRAYWHDQNEPIPYFKCEHHCCSYGCRNVSETDNAATSTAKGLDANFQDVAAGDAAGRRFDMERGLLETGHEKAFRQTPQNRFSAAFRTARLSHARSDSESTDIEDVDDTPAIEEAQAAPIMHAASWEPMPDPQDYSTTRKPTYRPMPPPRMDSLADKPLPPIISRDALSPEVPQETSTGRGTTTMGPAAIDMDRHELGRFGYAYDNSAFPAEPAQSSSENPFSDPGPTSDNRALVAENPREPPPVPRQEQARFHEEFTSPELGRGYAPEATNQLTPEESRAIAQEEIRRFAAEGARRAVPPALYYPPPPRARSEADEDGLVEKEKDEEPKETWLSKILRTGSAQKTMKPKEKKAEKKAEKKKKRRRCFFFIFSGLLAMVILILVLVLTLTLNQTDIPAQTSWLNLTNYPPIPTGIATIIRPNNAKSVDGCVAPNTMWSCAVPKEQQASIAPNEPNQPNFRVEIRFENGTNLTNSSNFARRGGYDGMSATQFFRRGFLKIRQSFSDSLFQPNPAPPSAEDQAFLGNTTDGNDEPFGGEATPFFMSFLSAQDVTSSKFRMLKRQESSNSTNSSSTLLPDVSSDIPPPDINSDGTAAAANLMPFPSAQPLMLYNRGRIDEHYGFYTYFDRSIFLRSASLANISTVGEVPEDENGGSFEDAASLRCTWAQTRFLVQIWTNAGSDLRLLPSSNSSNTSTSFSSSSSSANDFNPPGSFPYPVTITLDRHGGDIDLKSLYCYGMDDNEQIISSEKQFQIEDRGFGGTLVNPAQGLFKTINVTLAEGGPGGIDGGTGGCGCAWENFEST